MRLAIIRGYVTSTVKHKSLAGARLLIAQPVDQDDKPDGAPQVVLDPLGTALHEKVILCSDGSWARTYLNDPRSPCRWWVMGIVDEPSGRSAVA
ncbi:MAG TPA: EutN/CcmL family microcompartment protein [Opitutales bacterium]|jgi:ethanolamine utilization protein EutN|nr:EutN/CcmL family microcompartment protein [Opitutales bacterium]